jgi:hypothetical protein
VPRSSTVSRPPAPRSTGSTTRPSGGAPSIRLPEKPGDGPPRYLIDIADSKGSNNKPGQGPKDGDYTHRPRHHGYPYYYPYYYPHRYYGIGYDYGFGYGYFGRYYPRGYPYYFYGPYGYFYAPHLGVGYGVGGGGGGGGGAAYGDGLGALDLNVKPKDAMVYVDGDAIGPVDRYDGYPSYLWLEPGTYNLSFYLEGYQTLTLQHTVLSEVVISVKERLQPGVATPPPAALADAPPELPDSGEAPEVPQATVGRLLLTIRPPDAAVYLDGHFLGTAGELAQLSAGLVVEPGRHVLELVRPGYQTEEVPVTVPADEQIEVDLELRPR